MQLICQNQKSYTLRFTCTLQFTQKRLTQYQSRRKVWKSGGKVHIASAKYSSQFYFTIEERLTHYQGRRKVWEPGGKYQSVFLNDKVFASILAKTWRRGAIDIAPLSLQFHRPWIILWRVFPFPCRNIGGSHYWLIVFSCFCSLLYLGQNWLGRVCWQSPLSPGFRQAWIILWRVFPFPCKNDATESPQH